MPKKTHPNNLKVLVTLPAWQWDLIQSAITEYNAKNPAEKIGTDDVVASAIKAYITKA